MEDTTTSAGRKLRAPWTQKDEATLRDLTGEGRTDAQIAAHMARDVKLIGRKRRALNIDRGVAAPAVGLWSDVTRANGYAFDISGSRTVSAAVLPDALERRPATGLAWGACSSAIE